MNLPGGMRPIMALEPSGLAKLRRARRFDDLDLRHLSAGFEALGYSEHPSCMAA